MVICPTEGVYGLSCSPRYPEAIGRIIRLKKRAQSKGLILVGESMEQIADYVNWQALTEDDLALLRTHWPGPVTFILPMSGLCSPLLCGTHQSAALRVTAFATLREICRELGGPVISTSANLSGASAVSEFTHLNQAVLDGADVALNLPCGGLLEPTAIYNILSGTLLRESSHWKQHG